ncbi:MAG: hypothetical protein K2Z80_19765 [Xanthobacteraceae bacterium]|nr:hypothetical protein [Xanthobacteraceae bacterium]
MVRSVVPSLTATAILTADAAAQAQQPKAIFTAGEAGAYHGKFCPPISVAMAKAGFGGYVCTPSGGTPDNIARVLADPRSLGFAQLDVLARWALDNVEAARKLVVIRTLACEGLWLVARRMDMSTVRFGQVAGHARRLRFAVADGGSRASFEFMQKIDPDGLGRARNSRIVQNATVAIDTVATGGADVGFFVQFVEPSNPNVRLLHERKLNVLQVINRELIAATVVDTPVYQPQSFNLGEWSSVAGGGTLTTTCTPAAIVTGAPESIANSRDADEQRALLDKIKAAPDSAFLPKGGHLARLISGSRSVPSAVLKEMLAAYNVAKKRAEASAS